MTMLSHHAERVDLKGKRSPRRSALELFSINICYNLKPRVERHHKAHSCGQRPSIIIWMGSIYIHMYKTHNFIYIILYCPLPLLYSTECWIVRILTEHHSYMSAGSAVADTVCMQSEYRKEAAKQVFSVCMKLSCSLIIM